MTVDGQSYFQDEVCSLASIFKSEKFPLLSLPTSINVKILFIHSSEELKYCHSQKHLCLDVISPWFSLPKHAFFPTTSSTHAPLQILLGKYSHCILCSPRHHLPCTPWLRHYSFTHHSFLVDLGETFILITNMICARFLKYAILERYKLEEAHAPSSTPSIESEPKMLLFPKRFSSGCLLSQCTPVFIINITHDQESRLPICNKQMIQTCFMVSGHLLSSVCSIPLPEGSFCSVSVPWFQGWCLS